MQSGPGELPVAPSGEVSGLTMPTSSLHHTYSHEQRTMQPYDGVTSPLVEGVQPMAVYDTWLRKSGFSLAASALALVLIASAVAMYAGITTAQQQQQIVNDTRASIVTVVDLRAAVTEAETTVYEYIESNGAGGNQSYQAARSHVSSAVQRLEAPQGIGAGTSRDITQLRRLTPAALAALQSVALLAQSGQSAAAAERLSAGDVGQSLKSLRSVIERIQVAENSVLRNQISSAASAAQALLWISAATMLFVVGAFIAVLVVLRRTLALREQFAQERIRADAEAQVKIPGSHVPTDEGFPGSREP